MSNGKVGLGNVGPQRGDKGHDLGVGRRDRGLLLDVVQQFRNLVDDVLSHARKVVLEPGVKVVQRPRLFLPLEHVVDLGVAYLLPHLGDGRPHVGVDVGLVVPAERDDDLIIFICKFLAKSVATHFFFFKKKEKSKEKKQNKIKMI
jgi:hypothetical protein